MKTPNLTLPCVLALSSTISACQTAKSPQVTPATVAPASAITWIGEATPLEGAAQLKVGQALPHAVLVNLKMESATLPTDGRVKVINTIPSIDTPVCEQQTHILGETKTLHPSVGRVAISLDLPYAQRRFVEGSKLSNVEFFSDYRGGKFAEATGLRIQRNGLLARAVIVVDGQGIVRHMQVVPEITQMPDMEKAFAVANGLVERQ